ncbi:MAG TPA: YbaY family lipoprotein, partial [Xanthomonadales bacterium]|nr:YbaY family lipoprotein [Xanthomonadales bacterium]
MSRNFFLFASLFLLYACEAGTQAASNPDLQREVSRITGTVSYRERILLRPGSRLEIVLEDVSRADAPAVQIARMERTDPGQVPLPFELEYQPGAIDSLKSYAIRARILAPDGSLLFINDAQFPVITQDAGTHVDMLLVSASLKASSVLEVSDSEPPGMELQGQFSYQADAASFRDCNTGKTFPVEMSGDYQALEHAYLNSGIETGKGLTVNLLGRYLERPGMEENTNQIMLVVGEFQQISANQDCTPSEHADLFNTYWKLIELDGKRVQQETAPAQQREAHMLLDEQENRVNGHSGCNRFFGSFTLDDEKLVFSGLGSTMMACPTGMETEQAFLLALGETN